MATLDARKILDEAYQEAQKINTTSGNWYDNNQTRIQKTYALAYIADVAARLEQS